MYLTQDLNPAIIKRTYKRKPKPKEITFTNVGLKGIRLMANVGEDVHICQWEMKWGDCFVNRVAAYCNLNHMTQ